MRCEIFYYKGQEDLDIHTYKYFDGNVEAKAVVQISHGMAETAYRYKSFAEILVKNGYIVYINDHRGHGKTAKVVENVGCLSENNGFDDLVDDMYSLTNIIKSENKNLPIFLFGHSMGSFASQKYIIEHGKEIDGVVLCGSCGSQGIILSVGEIISLIMCKVKGRRYKSTLLDKIVFGNNNKGLEDVKTSVDWLSRDREEVEKYIDDPFCGTVFSCGFFYDFFRGLKYIEDKNNFSDIPVDLPIFIISGDKDPVGKNGKGVKDLYNRYNSLNVRDLSMKLYKDARHEILNEINREEVINDIVCWLDRRVFAWQTD